MKVVGFAGYSGSGKTTLVEQLIPELRLHGLRVSVVKHAHHKFDIDHVGKDTWRHREAGAYEVAVASDRRMALMREFEQEHTPSVHERLAETLELIHTKGIRDSLQVLGDLGTDALLVMLAGGLVLAVPTGLCTYVLVRRLFTRLRNRRRQAHLLNARES